MVKFLNFGMPENFAVIYLKFKQRGQTLRVFCQNGANGIANSVWVCTVCPDLSVQKLRIITVIPSCLGAIAWSVAMQVVPSSIPGYGIFFHED